MNARSLITVFVLFVAVGCSPIAKMDNDERSFRARPRNYGHTNIVADADKPEHWCFADTPTVQEANSMEILNTINDSLIALSLPTVKTNDVRVGRISEIKGGWIYYQWPDYPLGDLRITFVQEYGMLDGEFRVHTVWKPSHTNNGKWQQAPHL